ncbi:MAG: hypothetical protein V5783_10180 [Pontiella sp.]
MNKSIFSILAVVMVVGVAAADRKSEVTLVMVPREDGAVRLGLDIAHRYPTLLVSYQVLPNQPPSLHGWSGKEWVNISLDNFRTGHFFRTEPDSALVVEKEGTAILETLIPPADWCNAAYRITTTESRPLLHLLGQYYDFKYKDWQWFSAHYKLSMDAINPDGLNVAWYHKRFADNLKKNPVAVDDLQFWGVIRHPVILEEYPETVEELPETVEEEARPEMELPEDPEVNPLMNAAPEAIVLGAGDAEEDKEIE